MGEISDTPLKLQFDRRVRLGFRGAAITLTLDSSYATSLMPLRDSKRQPTIMSMKVAPAAMCNAGCCTLLRRSVYSRPTWL